MAKCSAGIHLRNFYLTKCLFATKTLRNKEKVKSKKAKGKRKLEIGNWKLDPEYSGEIGK